MTRGPADKVDPDWSPDGSRLVYQGNRYGSLDVYVRGLRHGTVTRLTHGPAIDWAPAWSPDGTKIAYTRLSRRESQDVVILDISSGERLRLEMAGTSELEPNWQPV